GGEIVMAIGNRGYVGLTRVEEGRLNVAAAIDAGLLHGRTISEAIETLLTESGVRVANNLKTAAWHGTPPLTNEPSWVAAKRLFVVGDAGGYVEPFTGEGIATALESARMVAPLAAQACHGWNESFGRQWDEMHRQTVRERQATCRRLAWLLRHPTATSM